MVFAASLLGALHLGEAVKNKPESSDVVSLSKTIDEAHPFLCGKQVDQTPRKWQLPNECGRPVQNIAIQFAFS